MEVIYDKSKQRVPLKTWCPVDELEESALQQALDVCNHPAAFHHVALMPDAHSGYGLPVGGVAALKNAVSPYMVGVDIGCGMCAVRTQWPLSQVKPLLPEIITEIKRTIPMGFAHRTPVNTTSNLWQFMEPLKLKPSVWEGAEEQIGTLGGGNHFIEIQKDRADEVWLMVHSGSRNIGHRVCSHFHKVALELNQRYHSALPNDQVAFLPLQTPEGRAYLEAMEYCLLFAKQNRMAIMYLASQAMRKFLGSQFEWNWETVLNIHHNYAAIENHFGQNVVVHRKGATLAREGTEGIIPGSMGTESYLVRGLGNPDSFHSCSHGAGRRMSRTAAKQTIPMDTFEKSMEGITFTPTPQTLDESPAAYKDIHRVMAQQSDLATPVVTLRPVAPIKDDTPRKRRPKK